MVSSTSRSYPLHRLPIRDFVIDNVCIHDKKGINPEIIFHVIKNPHDPAAKRLLSEKPDDLKRIRELGTQIKVKGDIDIYAQPVILNKMLENYRDSDEERIYAENASLGLLNYKELQAIANRERHIIYSNAQPEYQYTYMLMDTIVKVAQITQNKERFLADIGQGYISASEEDAYEILGGPLPGETSTQAVRRAQVRWDNAVSYINFLIDKTDKYNVSLSDIPPVLGIDSLLSERFNREPELPIIFPKEQMSKITGRMISSSKHILLKPYRQYNPIGASRVVRDIRRLAKDNMQYKYLLIKKKQDFANNNLREITFAEQLLAGTQEELSRLQKATATGKTTKGKQALIVPVGTSKKPATEAPSSFDFSKLPGTPNCKIFIPTKGMPASMLPVDAMVNDTDQQLTMQSIGIISKEIVNAAGKEALLKEVKDLETTKHPRYGNGKCHPGTAVITGSGDLKHKNGKTRMLVHTVTMKKSMRDEGFTKTTFNAVLQRNYDNVLQAALDHNAHTDSEKYKIHTLLMHPLGDHEIEMYKVRTSLSYFAISMVKYIHKLKEEDITVVFCCPDTKDAHIAQRTVEQYLNIQTPAA